MEHQKKNNFFFFLQWMCTLVQHLRRTAGRISEEQQAGCSQVTTFKALENLLFPGSAVCVNEYYSAR